MQNEEDDHNREVISHLQKVQHHEYEHSEELDEIKKVGEDYMNKENQNHDGIETGNRK